VSVLSRRAATADARRATEQALLDATVALLDEGDAYAAISIEQIVRRAGVSRPTFYAYFRDKRALVLQLGDEVRRELVAVAEPWLRGDDDDAAGTLEALLDVYLRYASTVRAVTEATTYDQDVAALWRGLHDGFLPAVEARIRAGHPDLADERVAARAYALVWMTERALSDNAARPTVDRDALIAELARIWDDATSPTGA